MTHAWVDEAHEATLALAAAGDEPPEALLGRLGPVEHLGNRTFDEALDLQGELYDRDVEQEQAIVQADTLQGIGGAWLVTLEPNGFRADFLLAELAAGRDAASLFWNVNSVMRVRRHQAGLEVLVFDPLDDEDDLPEEARGLPFGAEAPLSSALTLIERWTGVAVSEAWFHGPKPTYRLTATVG